MASRPSLIYVHPKRFFFVAKDIEALSARHRVFAQSFIHGPSMLLPWHLLRQATFLLGARLRGARTVIAHFAGYHTVLPVLLGLRTHIIVAGSDACSFPGIRYGSFRKPLMRRAMTFSMRGATTMLPVHASLQAFQNTYSDMGPREQGYGHFIPDLRTPSLPLPYGFSPEQWTMGDDHRDANSALCVAFGARYADPVFLRKGLDLILKAAERSPHMHFTLVGSADPEGYSDVPGNVRCLGTVTPAELRKLYATHSIYLQPSIMEGFPNALCEAMLCGCLPIVSNMTAMPSIVGGTGVVLEHRDVGELMRALDTITAWPEDKVARKRREARERIEPFTMSARLATLESLLRAEDREKA